MPKMDTTMMRLALFAWAYIGNILIFVFWLLPLSLFVLLFGGNIKINIEGAQNAFKD